jgi:hypothetical protein
MFKYLLIVLSLVMLASCGDQSGSNGQSQEGSSASGSVQDGQLIKGVGTIVHDELEGGFWGIMTDSGTRYELVSLPEKFKKAGASVKFTGVEVKDAASIHMWGKILDIKSIEYAD